MCETLKRQFYAACPIWYWPVLWWQFIVMEQYLGDLYAATGKAEMTYGLALGPRGTLHIVFLSDAARHFAMHGPKPRQNFRPLRFEAPPPDHIRRHANAGEGARVDLPLRAAPLSSQLYLDPG